MQISALRPDRPLPPLAGSTRSAPRHPVRIARAARRDGFHDAVTDDRRIAQQIAAHALQVPVVAVGWLVLQPSRLSIARLTYCASSRASSTTVLLLMSGQIVLQLGATEHILTSGEGATIPGGTPHRFFNDRAPRRAS